VDVNEDARGGWECGADAGDGMSGRVGWHLEDAEQVG
jgi:hypothetical protein